MFRVMRLRFVGIRCCCCRAGLGRRAAIWTPPVTGSSWGLVPSVCVGTVPPLRAALWPVRRGCPGNGRADHMARKTRRLPASGGTKTGATFKQRYEEAECRRAVIMQRLAGLNEKARAHPGYRRAATLLNQTFHKASVAQRLATLHAAEWLISVCGGAPRRPCVFSGRRLPANCWRDRTSRCGGGGASGVPWPGGLRLPRSGWRAPGTPFAQGGVLGAARPVC